ncbi:MAG: alpha/beta hydrolase [Acidobacteriota bacterium]
MESVRLGGVTQWISVAGEGAGKPVLLWLHGGPGAAETPWLRRFARPLERALAVVSWDQRGAGKSWASIAPRSGMTIDRLVEDTVELAERFASGAPGKKILLAGHSFGAALGVLAASRRPDVFEAFFAVAPIVHVRENERLSWRLVVEEARASGRTIVLDKLVSAGPPPYAGEGAFEKYLYLLGWSERFGGEAAGPSPFRLQALEAIEDFEEYDGRDREMYWSAYADSYASLLPELETLDLLSRVPRLEIPLFVAAGRHDRTTVLEITARWFEGVESPRKELRVFERSAHSPVYEEPEAFAEWIESILPTLRR